MKESPRAGAPRSGRGTICPFSVFPLVLLSFLANLRPIPVTRPSVILLDFPCFIGILMPKILSNSGKMPKGQITNGSIFCRQIGQSWPKSTIKRRKKAKGQMVPFSRKNSPQNPPTVCRKSQSMSPKATPNKVTLPDFLLLLSSLANDDRPHVPHFPFFRLYFACFSCVLQHSRGWSACSAGSMDWAWGNWDGFGCIPLKQCQESRKRTSSRLLRLSRDFVQTLRKFLGS